MSLSVDEPRLPLFGVRGWLLLLCIILTVINPLGVLFGLARPLYHVVAGGLSHRQVAAVLLDTFIRLAVAGYGVYAGARLWAALPGAVAAGKRYFALRLLVAIIWPWLLLAVSGAGRSPLFLQVWLLDVVGALIWFLIWYFYLVRSRRVANTYSEDWEGSRA